MTNRRLLSTFQEQMIEIKKNVFFPYLIIIFVGLGFWFYWTQIRVINIRRQCYQEVFTPSVKNATWSAGKIWRKLYPAYDMAKASRMDDGFWGWGYPPADVEFTNYKQCLIWKGSTATLLDIF